MPRFALFFLSLIILLPSNSVTGQNEAGLRRSFFFEFGGSGGLGSLNYEAEFCKKSNSTFTFRSGLSIAPVDRNNGAGIVFPLMVNMLIGKSANKFEAGVGQGITITTHGAFFFLTTAALGYRHQPENKKWFFRVTYTPLISWLVDFQVQQWFGFSLGYTFKHKAK